MQIRVEAVVDDQWGARMIRQMPFMIMRAVNNVAFDARAEVQGELPKRFKLKNTWTLRQILVSKATKATLTAAVTAPDYMAKQEDGGTVKPLGKHLAAPDYMRGKIIRQGNRPRAMLDKPGVFMLKRGGGTSIVQRRGKRSLRVLFWLTGQQQYDKRLDMYRTVHKVVDKRFAMRFTEAFTHAQATGR